MNILLINHHAGSPRHGMEYRPYYLAREWLRRGHRVTVVAATASHVRTAAPAVARSGESEDIDGIRYVWVRTPPYDGNGARRAVNMFAFVAGLYRLGGWLAQEVEPHVVIASSTYPLDSLRACRIARRCGARLVHEVHDLWPLTPMELGGMSRWHPFIAVMQWAEHHAYRHADRVVSMLPCAEPYMRERRLAEGKSVHVPNGICVEEWRAGGEAVPRERAEALGLCSRRAGSWLGMREPTPTPWRRSWRQPH